MIFKLKIFIFFISLIISQIHVKAQLSPGKLSKAHAHLEGLSNCTKCHILGESESTQKCLECHTEIKNLISQNKGYHASANVKGKVCHECHGEHFGLNFEIVRFNEDNFDHRLTGYPLEGSHQRIDCGDCHNDEFIKNDISQKKGKTYLGLITDCASCHEDYHRNSLSGNCTLCHNQESFRPAPGFNHAQTAFPLAGRHASVECVKCHPVEIQNEKEFQKFAGIRFSNCTECHDDVHNNKFGKNCQSCHNESSFQDVKNIAAFNHDRTDFPLTGMHRFAACKECHAASYTEPLPHDLCSDCHSDYHKGEFQNQGISPDCKECHGTNGFSPSSYSIERHNLSSFPLDGAHLATPCFSCHKKYDDIWKFSDFDKGCTDCHINIHENYLDTKYQPDGDCTTCHSVFKWGKISFDHHATNFALQGSHKTVSCRECHFKEYEGEITSQQFKWESQNCTNCHADVHAGQFIKNGNNNCEQCHSFDNWSPERFNHDKARFKLDGEHIYLECKECHKYNEDTGGKYIVYKFKDITCKSCH